jgi:aryl-alcohol dehydrogenase-like predicted oxidoreductase
MGMSEFYGDKNDNESINVLTKAFEIGYRHFDTADMYGKGHNEKLLGSFMKKMKNQRREIFLATKGGIQRDVSGPGSIGIDSHPDYIRKACESSLKRLGVEYIDLYYLHRRNPDIPIEDTIGVMKELMNEGKIMAIGLSEVSAKTLVKASQIAPITAIQSEYSLWTRDPEDGILDSCLKVGTRFVAYSPMGRGFLTGKLDKNISKKEGDLRARLPRFQPEAFEKNARLLDVISKIANELNATNAQISLAWVLSQNPIIKAIPGTTTTKHLQDNFDSQNITLEDEHLKILRDAFLPEKIDGQRYPEPLLKTVNT